ncbi:helix-turn-helix domain-containing protein [Streptomyces prunicolor]|uniref:helix-turn-helix domain-containing protein n=1 Tax=Streptomyces prunicolor TaxID=67348 RepID=UPI003416E1E3
MAERYGTNRQSPHTWRKRFEQERPDGPADKSRRPRTGPARLPAAVEAMVREARRQHPRRGAWRISHQSAQRQDAPVPSRATVHRALARNGLITAQVQEHRRKYRTCQREAPSPCPVRFPQNNTMFAGCDASGRRGRRATPCWAARRAVGRPRGSGGPAGRSGRRRTVGGERGAGSVERGSGGRVRSGTLGSSWRSTALRMCTRNDVSAWDGPPLLRAAGR